MLNKYLEFVVIENISGFNSLIHTAPEHFHRHTFGTDQRHIPGVQKNVRLHAELPSCKRTFLWDTLYN